MLLPPVASHCSDTAPQAPGSWHLTRLALIVPRAMPVIRDQLGHSSLAVTDRYLRNVAPGEVIATMLRRQWAEPGGRRAR